jgi:Domain of unknown function (DUF4260)
MLRTRAVQRRAQHRPASRKVGFGWWQGKPLVLGLVWLAHIGADRLLGYGLKYDDNFQHTHLGQLGRPEEDRDNPDGIPEAR